ncbi:MAG: DUF6364 family protein [bacterium]
MGSTKLTLRLEEEVIHSAKDYAKKHSTSISKIVTVYLKSLSEQKETKESISYIVKELSGIIPEAVDTQKLLDDYHLHLQNKYK